VSKENVLYIYKSPAVMKGRKSIKELIHRFVGKFDTKARLKMISTILPLLFRKATIATYNVAALAGTARAKAGPKPGKKAFTPPLA
jgi:hypothetical protein